MAYIEISNLPVTLNLDNDSVFPVVYQGETKKVSFTALKSLLQFFQSASYNKTTGVFTFGLSNSTQASLPTELNLSIKAISIVDGNVTITKQDGSTSTLSGLQLEITSENKLDADLIDDSSSTNKFTNTTEKAGWNAKYSKPETGIPSTDLASAAQTSLGKADTALQSTDIVSSVDSSSTNSKAVGAKLFYDTIGDINTLLDTINGEVI